MPNIPRKHFIAMKNITLKLLTLSEFCWRNQKTFAMNPLDPAAFETYETLQSYKNEVKTADFRTMTKSIGNQILVDEESAIYLPPLDDDPLFVPLLSMDIDSDEGPKANFRVDLYKLEDSLHHMGFRFETPSLEGVKHKYYHVQPIEAAMGRVAAKVQRSVNVPGKSPCIPIHADSPVALILSLILSLYGIQGFQQISDEITIDSKFLVGLKTCLDIGKSWTRGWNE